MATQSGGQTTSGHALVSQIQNFVQVLLTRSKRKWGGERCKVLKLQLVSALVSTGFGGKKSTAVAFWTGRVEGVETINCGSKGFGHDLHEKHESTEKGGKTRPSRGGESQHERNKKKTNHGKEGTPMGGAPQTSGFPELRDETSGFTAGSPLRKKRAGGTAIGGKKKKNRRENKMTLKNHFAQGRMRQKKPSPTWNARVVRLL